MKRILLLFAIAFVAISIATYANTSSFLFTTQLICENLAGNRDTLTIGMLDYGEEAPQITSYSEQEAFDAISKNFTVFFEEYNVNTRQETFCKNTHIAYDNGIQYMQLASILVPVQYLPVTIKWHKDDFQNQEGDMLNAIDGSFITDMIGWPDAACGNSHIITMREQDSFTISIPLEEEKSCFIEQIGEQEFYKCLITITSKRQYDNNVHNVVEGYSPRTYKDSYYTIIDNYNDIKGKWINTENNIILTIGEDGEVLEGYFKNWYVYFNENTCQFEQQFKGGNRVFKTAYYLDENMLTFDKFPITSLDEQIENISFVKATNAIENVRKKDIPQDAICTVYSPIGMIVLSGVRMQDINNLLTKGIYIISATDGKNDYIMKVGIFD